MRSLPRQLQHGPDGAETELLDTERDPDAMRRALAEIGGLGPSTVEDPIPAALMAEHFRLEAETETSDFDTEGEFNSAARQNG